MSAVTEQNDPSGISWPPILRAELEGTAPVRRPWYLSVGPAYLTIFIWAPFFDPLWRHDFKYGGLGGLAWKAALAAALCFGLFYYPTAMWGYRTGRRLGVVAASTFGTAGSEWITGVLLAVAEIVWFAVAIDYGVQSTLLGLVTCGLLPQRVMASWSIGDMLLRNPVALCVSVFWIFITGMAGLLRLTGVIAALMKVYSPVALVLLLIAAVWELPGLAIFQNGAVFAGKTFPPDPPHLSAFPVFLGFFSMVGLMSVEWGAACARRRDVVVGGLAGIVAAATTAACMSLIVLAGAVGRLHAAREAELPTLDVTPVHSFRWAVAHGVGGASAAVMLILFGLAALAPAVFSSFLFVRKLFARWPGVRRIDWGWIGCTASFVLVATGWPGRLEAVDHVLGIIFAPAVGAMVGDYVAQRGRWIGVRMGVHPPGLIAWFLGMGARLILDLLGQRGFLPAPSLIASPIAGFAAAAMAYLILARAGLERPAVAIETFPGGSGEMLAASSSANDGTRGPE